MVIAVILVWMMQMALHQIVSVTTMRNRLMTTLRAVGMLCVVGAADVRGRTGGRIRTAVGELMFVHMAVPTVNTVQMAVVEIVDVVVVLRAPTAEDVIFHREIAPLVQARDGRLHVLVGSRHEVRLDSRRLAKLVPDISERDVYVCGPEAFADRIAAASRRLGVSHDRVHSESFAF